MNFQVVSLIFLELFQMQKVELYLVREVSSFTQEDGITSALADKS